MMDLLLMLLVLVLVLDMVHQFMVAGWFSSGAGLLDLEAGVLVQFWCWFWTFVLVLEL
jgi:hypothetical protein